jgi:type IV pilus assembly protein PilW
MSRLPHPRRAGGFSVVELMVSVVVGMLALMFATRLIVGAEQNKQASLGGSDSMQNGMLAMFSISGDAAQAGYGLNDPIITGCNTVFSDTDGFALATAMRDTTVVRPLAAAIIESNGVNPDRLSLYSGSSMSGTGTVRVTSNYANGTQVDVDRRPYGFARDDVIVVAPETAGGDCALAQLSADPGTLAAPPAQQSIFIASGEGRRFNSGALGVQFSAGQARLFNLGNVKKLAFHTWSVSDGFLQLRSTDLAGSSTTPSTVIDNVVSIKAQYGLDTRLGMNFTPQDGMQIGLWSASMTDADSDGVVGGAGDYQRIAALRIAVVARSKNPEKPNTDGSCSTTSAKPVVFDSVEPQGVAKVPITVEVGVTGDPADWTCYRYRVFETIVPLRNAGWRPNP